MFYVTFEPTNVVDHADGDRKYTLVYGIGYIHFSIHKLYYPDYFLFVIGLSIISPVRICPDVAGITVSSKKLAITSEMVCLISL